jgi:hypothetical protein
MAKRNLRIIKRVKNIPLLAVCDACNAQFFTNPNSQGQMGSAQSAIQHQFNAHKCKVDDSKKASAV